MRTTTHFIDHRTTCYYWCFHAHALSNAKRKARRIAFAKATEEWFSHFARTYPWLWKHMSFSAKVTARNIFRYKSRMLMTIFGVAGCTGLLVMGFGIRDSLQGFGNIQYSAVQKMMSSL